MNYIKGTIKSGDVVIFINNWAVHGIGRYTIDQVKPRNMENKPQPDDVLIFKLKNSESWYSEEWFGLGNITSTFRLLTDKELHSEDFDKRLEEQLI